MLNVLNTLIALSIQSFLRESTFWPILCLVQFACPDDEWILDVQAEGIDLTPFFELMGNEGVVKVFHAARQDVEIIYKLAGLIPHQSLIAK